MDPLTAALRNVASVMRQLDAIEVILAGVSCVLADHAVAAKKGASLPATATRTSSARNARKAS
jgi:hypothetical protein